MTLKQIEYFQTVCRRKNISTAAEELFISRSVISRAIAELEEEFGAPLFTRSRTGVVLTESGELLAHLFDTFTDGCAAVKERIGHLQAQVQMGPLHLGVTPTNIYCIYQTYLADFQRRYPYIPLRVEEHSALESEKLLSAGQLDAFFTPATSDSSMFEALELYQNPIMLGVAEGDPLAARETVSISDILDLPLGFFNAPMPIEGILNNCFRALGKTPNVVLRTSDHMLLRDLTLQGQLYPILPLDMMATWQGARQIPLAFFHPSINRLVWSRMLKPSPTLETFLRFMGEQIK